MNLAKDSILKMLTVVLVLKDRYEFTERWFNYINEIDPFIYIIIADGSRNPLALDQLSKFRIESKIEYRHYGEDISISDFVSKIDRVLGEVKTKYVILMNNDDFPIIKSMITAIEFLEANSDYVCAMGDCMDVAVSEKFNSNIGNHVYGSLMILQSLYSNKSIDDSMITERLNSYLQSYESFWHSIYRTEVLKKVYNSCKKSKLDSMLTYELASNLHTLIYGKMKRLDNSTFMLHQCHPKMEAKKLPNPADYTIKPEWKKEFKIVFDGFTSAANVFLDNELNSDDLVSTYLRNRSINLEFFKNKKQLGLGKVLNRSKLKIGAAKYYINIYIASFVIPKNKLIKLSSNSIQEVFYIKEFLSREYKKLF